MRPPVIAHVVATFPPYRGGTGNVAYHNALELARRGHRVEVLTGPSLPGEHDDPPGVTVHRLPAPLKLGNAPLTPGLLSAVSRYSLVHLHWPYIFGADLTWLTCRLAGVPYVLTYHHDLLASFRWQFGPYQALSGPLLLRGAARVLPVSLDHFRASPMHRYVADRPERVVEQANGVDVNRFHPGLDGARVRAHIGVSDRVVVVGYLGAMDRAHAFKGVPTLLDALAAVQEPVHLLAVGGGDLQPEYCGRARKLGLQTSWTGSVSAEELPSHIAAMDLLVLPSVGFGAESFGIVLIEAMAAGKPVIATSLPGVRRVVDDGQNGLLVPPDDASALAAAITRLAADSELRRRLGTAGRAKVEARYDWRELAAQLEAHYRDVLAESID